MRAKTSMVPTTVCLALAVALSTLVGVSSADAGHAPRCHGLVATVVGTSHDDVLRGTPGRDVITGWAGRDKIRGGGGADVICGGADSDRLFGGPGNDRLFGEDSDNATEQLDGGPGNDLLNLGRRPTSYDRFSFGSARRGVTIDLKRRRAVGEGHDRLVFHRTDGTTISVETVLGSPHDDVIYGTEHEDKIYGGAGDDRIFGRAGSDSISGEFGLRSRSRNLHSTDVLDGGAGNDELRAAHGPDIVRGRGGGDAILIESDGVSARGNAGNDTVFLFLTHRDSDVRGGADLDRLVVRTGRAPSGTSFVSTAFDQASGTAVVTRSDDTTWSEHFSGFTFYEWAGPLDWSFEGKGESTNLRVDGTSLRAHMGAGDDSVIGTPNHDVLDGGDGDDAVFNSGGADDCTNFEAGTCS
jgi:Ca2+-binding RTX toxin-like protein